MEREETPVVSPTLVRSTEPNYGTIDSPLRRLPFHYAATDRRGVSVGTEVGRSGTEEGLGRGMEKREVSAQAARYRYYNRLAPEPESILQIPDHILPTRFFTFYLPVVSDRQLVTSGQSSLITILTIWNTMMGTSVLVMPWAFGQAGFSTAICMMVAMALLTYYTALKTLESVDTLPQLSHAGGVVEFIDVCRFYLGRCGEYTGMAFSLLALLGAAIVYWVLMSNFLYHSVLYVYKSLSSSLPMSVVMSENVTKEIYATCGGFYCPARLETHRDRHHTTGLDVLDLYFDEVKTVPFYLIIVLLPLLQFKSPTFFIKFNALGVLSVIFLFGFVTTKLVQCGINISFSNPDLIDYSPQFRTSFLSLPGTLGLAFFIHNCVVSIMRNQRHPQNNRRDLGIGYSLVALTYIIIAICFYVSFPLNKKICIEDNFLNNFIGEDVMAFAARIFLFFQMLTVYPLISYLLRSQLLHFLYQQVWPGLPHVIIVNLAVISICVLFARFLPQIGTIIRFTGAFCGLAYIFTLPCIIYIFSNYKNGRLTKTNLIPHLIIITIGIANFIGQFLHND